MHRLESMVQALGKCIYMASVLWKVSWMGDSLQYVLYDYDTTNAVGASVLDGLQVPSWPDQRLEVDESGSIVAEATVE